MKLTKIDIAIVVFVVGTVGSYIAWGLQGVIAFVVVAAGLLIWRLNSIDDAAEALPQYKSDRYDSGIAQPTQEKVVDYFGSARVTEMQKSALIEAAMSGFIYKKSTVSNKATDKNSFNDRTISSLQDRGLLDYSGGGRHRITETGLSILAQYGIDVSNAWRPKAWATLRIEYSDEQGGMTERVVDIFEADRYRFIAYCRLRDGEVRSFIVSNVLSAVDLATGEQVENLSAWLSAHDRQAVV